MGLPFLYPLPNRVTSLFQDPGRTNHNGVDIVGKASSATEADKIPIHAVGSGTVKGIYYYKKDPNSTSRNWERGQYIDVTASNGDVHRYQHLIVGSYTCKVGDRVTEGLTFIGFMGESGLSFGAHLHFEVLRNSSPIDPSDTLGIESGKKGIFYGDPNNTGEPPPTVDPLEEEYNRAKAARDEARSSLQGAEARVGNDGTRLNGLLDSLTETSEAQLRQAEATVKEWADATKPLMENLQTQLEQIGRNV